jgi:hypothetical protein
MECQQLKDIIKKNGFDIVNVDEKRCIIDFKHPKIVLEPPVAYYLSSVVLKDGVETIVRSKVEGGKELYLDYCCENGENVCRPHVHMGDKILSVEAKFHQNPMEKFNRLLQEMI